MKKDVRFGEGKTRIFLDPMTETFYDMASESDREALSKKYDLEMYWVSRTGLSGGGKLNIDNTPLMEVGYYRLRGEKSGYRPYGRNDNEFGKPVALGYLGEVYLLVPWVKDSSDGCPQGILRKFPVVLTDGRFAVAFLDSRYIVPTSMLRWAQNSNWNTSKESDERIDDAWVKKTTTAYISPSAITEQVIWSFNNEDHMKGPNAMDFLQVERMRGLLNPELAEEFQPFWPSAKEFKKAQEFYPREGEPVESFMESKGFRRGQYRPEEEPFFWYQDNSGRCFRHFGHEDPRFIEGHIVGRWYGDGHGMIYRREENAVYAFVQADNGYEYEIEMWAWLFWKNPDEVRRQCVENIHRKMEADDAWQEKWRRKKMVEQEVRDQLLERMKASPNIPISTEDARAVGNCQPGIERFLERYGLPTSGTLGFLAEHERIESMLHQNDFRRVVLHALANHA